MLRRPIPRAMVKLKIIGPRILVCRNCIRFDRRIGGVWATESTLWLSQPRIRWNHCRRLLQSTAAFVNDKLIVGPHLAFNNFRIGAVVETELDRYSSRLSVAQDPELTSHPAAS